MTKVIDRTKTKENKKLKPIEFIRYVEGGENGETTFTPNDYDNVERIATKEETGDYDIILAWDEGMEQKSIYLGHWNDGLIE